MQKRMQVPCEYKCCVSAHDNEIAKLKLSYKRIYIEQALLDDAWKKWMILWEWYIQDIAWLSGSRIMRKPFYYAAIFFNLSVYVPITLDECHTWFHSYGHRRAMRNGKVTKHSNQNDNVCLQRDLNQQLTFCSLQNLTKCLRPIGHADWDNEFCLKLLHYPGI